jgi:serine/threonine kinase 38
MENNDEGVRKEKNEVGPMADEEGDVGSSLTMERVAAAKQFIENHYKAQMKHIQERKER